MTNDDEELLEPEMTTMKAYERIFLINPCQECADNGGTLWCQDEIYCDYCGKAPLEYELKK